MRVLSQKGLYAGIIDVPYENVTIQQIDNIIWCRSNSSLSPYCNREVFAKYSSEGQARVALEMLHDVYCANQMYINASQEIQAKCLIDASEKDKKAYCGIFQFPENSKLNY